MFAATISLMKYILGEETSVFEFDGKENLPVYKISNNTFGFPKTIFDEIKGDSAERNAEIILDVLDKKKKNSAYYVTVANAAMGLYAAGYSDDLKKCAIKAEESITSGSAYSKLEELKNFSSKYV